MRPLSQCLIFLILCTIFTTLNSNECYPPQAQCVLPTAREEKALFNQINCESRRLYNSLDCEGKRRALFLANQFENKNLAVQQAAKEMSLRQREKVLDPYDFDEEINQENGQAPLEKRFGY